MAHDHSHPHTDETVLGRAFALIAGFMIVEAVAGWLTNSLTLMADAGHMFIDAGALGLAWWAARASRRDEDHAHSYGYHRMQVLATFINGLTLAVLVLLIVVEAIGRLANPQPMVAVPALLVAATGLIVNLVAFRILHPKGRATANVRAAALHVLGDILGSVAAIVAAVVVLTTGWLYADPLLAAVIAAILGRGAFRVLKESSHILLEGVPEGIDLPEVKRALAADVPGVIEIHHVHAWALNAEKPLVTLHALVDERSDLQHITGRIKAVLLERFGVDHSTVQVEHGPCPDD